MSPNSSSIKPNCSPLTELKAKGNEKTSVDRLKKLDRLCDLFEQSSTPSPESLRELLREEGELENRALFCELLEIGKEFQAEKNAWLVEFPDRTEEIERAFRMGATSDPVVAAASNEEAYEIIEEIARGGMGVVYRANQKKLNRTVALKKILSGTMASEAEVARFLIEAKAAAKITHPNIVQVYDTGEMDMQPFFAMELVEGISLAEKMNGQPQSIPWSCELMVRTADAIHHAHQSGIIHRDLKPSNVLLTRDEQPKVTDFGLAKVLSEGDSKTRTGDLMGTASYMAPEQALGKIESIGPWTDVYGLGAILYEMLVGRPPFKGETSWDTLSQLIENDPVPVNALRPESPQDLNTIVQKCLHKETERRYHSAEELRQDLTRFLAGKPILARPTSRMEHLVKWVRRNQTLSGTVIIATMLLMLSIGFGVFGILREKDRYKAQRDEAVSHLYEALVVDTRAQLIGQSGEFWFVAEDNLEQAVELDLPNRDDTELRNLAIEWMGCSAPCLTAIEFPKHAARINRVVSDGDGEFIAAGSNDGVLGVYRVRDREQVGRLRFDAAILDVLFLPDSNSLLVSTGDSQLHLVDREPFEGKEKLTSNSQAMKGYSANKIRLAKGGTIFLGCSDGFVRKAPNRFPLDINTLEGNLGAVADIDFDTAEEKVVAVGRDRKMAVWQIESGVSLKTVELSRTPTCVEFAIGDQQIAWSDTERFGVFFERFDEDVRELRPAFQLHTQAISQLADFGSINMVTASADGTVRLFDARTKQFFGAGIQNFGPVGSIDLGPERGFILAGYEKGHIVLWEINRSPFVRKLRGHYWSFFDQQNRLVSPGSRDIYLNETASLAESSVGIEGEIIGVWQTCHLQDAALAARAKHDGHVDFVRIKSGKVESGVDLFGDRTADRGIVWSLDRSRDGRWLVAGSGDPKNGYANLIDLETRKLVSQEVQNIRLVTDIKIHPNGKEVFSCSLDGSVDAWWLDNENQKLVHRGKLMNRPGYAFHSLTISNAGNRLAASSKDDRIYVWEIQPESKALPENFQIVEDLHGNAIQFVDFVLDDQFLVSGSENGSVAFVANLEIDRLFARKEQPKRVVRFKSGEGQVRNVVISADRKWMAVNSYVRPTYLWDFGQLETRLRKWKIHWDQDEGKNE